MKRNPDYNIMVNTKMSLSLLLYCFFFRSCLKWKKMESVYEIRCCEETQQHLSQASEWQCATVRVVDLLRGLHGACVSVVKE